MALERSALPKLGSIAPVERLGLGQALARKGNRFIRTSAVGAVCAVVLLLVLLIAAFAGQLAPYDPLAADYGQIQAPPSSAHLLGTDSLGRDVLSRIIYGAQTTLIVALASVLLGDSLGFIWGLASGYFGQRVDLVSQRVLDILMAFPTLILALVLMVGLGAGLTTVVIAIAITRVPNSGRIVRSMVLSVKELAYVEASRASGASRLRTMGVHVAPQCLAPFVVVSTAHLGSAIFIEAALSFLGVGVPPPTPSWGNMLGGVMASVFRPPWWLVFFPGLAITLTILAINLLGDALRDFIDPKLRGREL